MPANSPEYALKYNRRYRKKPGKLADMAQRQRARYAAEKAGKVSSWDSKEVDHINWTKAWNWQGNIRVISKVANRADWARKAIRKRKARLKY